LAEGCGDDIRVLAGDVSPDLKCNELRQRIAWQSTDNLESASSGQLGGVAFVLLSEKLSEALRGNESATDIRFTVRSKVRNIPMKGRIGILTKSEHFRGIRVLDIKAYKTCKTMIRNSVLVPDLLRRSNRTKTVYHSQSLTPEVLDLLFEAGFRDIDGLDSGRITPLMGCGTDRFIGGESSLHNLPWLLSHGANMDRILRNLEAGRPEGIIHQLAKHLGQNFRDDILYCCRVDSP
jgi:hypothetical protein